ncbi:MAG: M20/M25/M40 family metallo-hydrolase [Lachnospiraceae bacterium]
MNQTEINGERAYQFVSLFPYIREAGTAGESKAAKEIQEYLKSFGMEGEEECFSFWTYKNKEAKLLVTEPYQKEYRIIAYSNSQSTPIEGMETDFLYVEDADDISLSKAEGKIVLVNAPVRKDLYTALKRAKVAAFVCVAGTPIEKGEDLIPPIRHLPKMYEQQLIGASIHYQDAIQLVTLQASKAKILICQEKICCKSRNIIARITGTKQPEEVLTLTAHYDSVPAGPGAYDNMSGGAIIMELCRYFSNHPTERTLEFIWFGAEEKGMCGSKYYVNTHEEELKKHRFNMNVDLAGQMLGGNIFGVTGEAQIGKILLNMAKEVGIGASTLNKVWSSDSNCFAWKGIPAMTLNRDGFGMHTHYDTIELISSWSLKRSAILLGYIAESLGNAAYFPFARCMPKIFEDQLNQRFKEND